MGFEATYIIALGVTTRPISGPRRKANHADTQDLDFLTLELDFSTFLAIGTTGC
jgi:hypothetical protein